MSNDRQIKVKVCGMSLPGQLTALTDTGVDMAGFIFYDRSPRYIIPLLDPSALKQNGLLKKVGVFVDADHAFIKDHCKKFSLQMVQLHGNEEPALCKALQKDTELIKAFRVDVDTDIEKLQQRYKNVCDYFLFDTGGVGTGGSGKKFNWQALLNQKIEKPFFLSGGICGDDVDAVIEFARHPNAARLFAVDINSRFETGFAVKDMKAVKNFVDKLKSACSATFKQ